MKPPRRSRSGKGASLAPIAGPIWRRANRHTTGGLVNGRRNISQRSGRVTDNQPGPRVALRASWKEVLISDDFTCFRLPARTYWNLDL